MKKLLLLLILLICTSLYADGVINWKHSIQNEIITPKIRTLRSNATERLNGLNYLNTMRTGAGLIPYSANSQLDTAAYNHAYYLTENNLFGHNENESQYPTGFTGVDPWDRGDYAGYTTYCMYGENLSGGDDDIYEAIDGLMTAIYHRFGFLDFFSDEIGIGSSFDANYAYKSAYNFDTASQNSCSTNQNTNPQYILWPHRNFKKFQTSFGNTESPDPTPECVQGGITGNPISIEFNDIKNDAITMTSFKLYKDDGSEITNVKDPSSVPGLNSNQFVLFPMDSLSLDSHYSAEFKYTEASTAKTISWNFSTRRYENKRYEITDGNTYDVISGESYLLHLKHSDCNVTINSWDVTASIEHISADLFRITPTSSTDLTFYFYDGSYNPRLSIHLNIAPTDNAILPSKTDPIIIPIINYLLF